MEKISEDISRKDVDQLKKHFECLVKKYENDTRFSAMYVKFVFSNVIQELFQENQFSEGGTPVQLHESETDPCHYTGEYSEV